MNVVQTILSMAPAEWGFLPLDGIVEAPVLRPDGSILGTAGYDSTTRLFYAPDPNLRIPVMPDRPTADHVDVAKETVLELIQDFPFVDQVSRANAFAALLTPIIKPAISKPTPLGAISATAAGTGKSLLAELVSISATGRPAEMLSAPQDQDEWRKQITTALINGASVIVFDNVSQRLDSAELCKVLTADVWEPMSQYEFRFSVPGLQLGTTSNLAATCHGAVTGFGCMPRRQRHFCELTSPIQT
jgi:hypothetical protein